MAHKTSLTESIGLSEFFSKTVSESDVYLFAGLVGDFDPLHIDEEYCKSTQYKTRIAQGALIVGFMMAAAAKAAARIDATLPSLGLDRLRHTGPVFIGDTVRVAYTVTGFDAETRRGKADILATNQRGETVGVASHVFKSV